MESKERKMGIVLSYVTIIINCLIQLLYTPVLIRFLGQQEYGLYSLVASIIGYLCVLDFGFGNAIIVFTSKYKEQNEIDKIKKMHGMFKIIFAILGIVAALLSIILYFFVEKIFLNTMTNYEIIKMKYMILILALNLFLSFSFSIYNSIITAYEKFIFQKVVVIISSIVKPLIMIPIMLMGYKSVALCIVMTIVNFAVLISNYLFCKKKLLINIKYCGFDKSLFITILSYSIWIFLGIIVDKINWSVDQFILGAVSGTIAVSVYSVASTLNQLFINLSTAVSSVFLPKISKIVTQKNYLQSINDEFIKIGRIQFYIIYLICSGLILFGKQFIIMWAGEEFVESYYVALLLIIPVCIPLIQNLGLSIMQALNKYKFKSISSFLMAVVNIFISIILSKLYGAIGAALGTCISLIICNGLIMNIYYKKSINLDINVFWHNILKMFMILFIPTIIELFIINLHAFRGIVGYILNIIIYVIIYCIFAYEFVMNKYEKELVSKIFISLKERLRLKNESN